MTDLNFSLLPWQEEVWTDPTRFKVVVAGRRTGKTQFAAYRLIYERLRQEDGDVLYVAPTQGQARDLMWDLLLDIGRDIITKWNVNNLELTFINGKKIKLKGSDKPETMRGLKVAYVVMDEYADMRPDVWELIISPALTDLEGQGLFIGTPMGRNHFYELYKNAELNPDDRYKDYKGWHFTSFDNPMLPVAELEAAKQRLSSYAFRQEFMASFEARGSQYFKEDWIKYGDDPGVGEYFIACDLAGFEELGKRKSNKRLDNTAIAIVRVDRDGWFVEDIQVGRWDLNATAIRIFEAVRKYRPVSVGIEKGIAKQAVMSPLMDLMKRTGRFFRIVELTHGNNKKIDRIMWALEAKFENGWITLNKGDWNIQFMDELFQFPDPLTHDDMVDALAYVGQLAENTIYQEFNEADFDEWAPFDSIAGY